jgi:hypothetical protein
MSSMPPTVTSPANWMPSLAGHLSTVRTRQGLAWMVAENLARMSMWASLHPKERQHQRTRLVPPQPYQLPARDM